MTWQHPLLLALAPLVLLGTWWLFRRRDGADDTARLPHIARRWADRHGLHAAPARARGRTRGVLFACAALLALAALARPQWGEIVEPRRQRGREVMVALDLSRSMLADDVAPSRLARAKLLIDALLDQLRGERVGLTVFAGTAFVQSPLSADYEVLRDLLAGLDPSYLPQGGSNYAAMLTAASEAFGAQGDGDRYLVVLSDGEAHGSDWQALVPQLRARGIRVVGLGIGTPQGALVPAAAGGVATGADGTPVRSTLEPATLQALADETGGTYRDAATWVDIAELVGATVAQGRQGDYVERQHVRLDDRFQWFLAPALLLFLLSYWIEFPVLPLVRAHQTRGRRPQRAAAPALAAVLAGLVAWHSPCQARAATAGPPPPGPAAAVTPSSVDLAATIAALSGQPALDAADYARLADDTIRYAAQPDAPRGALRTGVLDDALAAVTRGEHTDRAAADWPALRQQLEALRNPPEPPPQEQANEQDQKPCDGAADDAAPPNDASDGGAPEDGDGSPEQAGGSPQAGAPPDEAQADQRAGEDAGGQSDEEDARPLEAAGLGDDDRDAAQEQAEQPATRLVGGGAVGDADDAAQAEAEALGDLRLADAVGRMRQVQQGDAPAVLFDRMNRAEGRPRPAANQQDW